MTKIQISWQDAVLELTTYEVSADRPVDSALQSERCLLHFSDPSLPLFSLRGLLKDAAHETGHHFWQSDNPHRAHPLFQDYSYALPFSPATLTNYLKYCAEYGEAAALTTDRFDYIRQHFK